MQFNLITMFGITGGIALCLFVAVKSHPLFAAPMLVLVFWTFYRPAIRNLPIGWSCSSCRSAWRSCCC